MTTYIVPNVKEAVVQQKGRLYKRQSYIKTYYFLYVLIGGPTIKKKMFIVTFLGQQ